MKKFKMALVMLWLVMVSLVSPIWLGLIYMDITGHGKGYSYSLGEETAISVGFGVMELILWVLSLFPVLVWLCIKLFSWKKIAALFPIISFVLLFVISVYLLGWNNFISLFGLS